MKFGMLSRILMFFSPFYMVGIIIISNHLKRKTYQLLFIAYSLSYSFFILMRNYDKDWAVTFNVYKTIFGQHSLP